MSRSIANIEVDENKFNSTNETENLHLPQFVATDKPGWLTDFNGAMEVIDEAAGVLQEQITEQYEDLESVHTQLDRVDDEINNPETGVRQVLHDTQARVTDLETTVGDEQHGLVKDVHTLQEDMVQTNTMAVKSNAQLGSIINLLCNKFSTAAQYNQGAYVYTENEDGSLNFLRCTQTTHGAFNPDKWEDVTEKLISALDNSGGGGGSQYVLPIAGDADDPDAVLGGVIIGEGLTIDPETGILSRTVTPTEGIGPDYYASSVRAGLVKPNGEAGLYVNSSNGLLSIVLDDNTMEFTNDGKLKAKPDTSRFAQGQGISLSNENVPSISVRLAAENSNLGFDGNGGLRAILPASAYEIVQGDGVTITTDSQTNAKTISLTQASTNTLGGVRPKSDSFAFESYDPEHPENKKMTIQLKENGGLQKQDGVGLSVKVDGDTVTINSNGELQANGGGGQPYVLPVASANTLGGVKVGSGLSIDANGVLEATGGGGSDYTPLDNSLDINNVTHKMNVKVDTSNGLSVDSNGLKVKVDDDTISMDGSGNLQANIPAQPIVKGASFSGYSDSEDTKVISFDPDAITLLRSEGIIELPTFIRTDAEGHDDIERYGIVNELLDDMSITGSTQSYILKKGTLCVQLTDELNYGWTIYNGSNNNPVDVSEIRVKYYQLIKDLDLLDLVTIDSGLNVSINNVDFQDYIVEQNGDSVHPPKFYPAVRGLQFSFQNTSPNSLAYIPTEKLLRAERIENLTFDSDEIAPEFIGRSGGRFIKLPKHSDGKQAIIYYPLTLELTQASRLIGFSPAQKLIYAVYSVYRVVNQTLSSGELVMNKVEIAQKRVVVPHNAFPNNPAALDEIAIKEYHYSGAAGYKHASVIVPAFNNTLGSDIVEGYTDLIGLDVILEVIDVTNGTVDRYYSNTLTGAGAAIDFRPIEPIVGYVVSH